MTSDKYLTDLALAGDLVGTDFDGWPEALKSSMLMTVVSNHAC